MKTNPNDLINNPGDTQGFPTECFKNFGLTKREYFAILALQGLLHDTSITDNQIDYMYPKKAILMADLLIAELNSTNET